MEAVEHRGHPGGGGRHLSHHLADRRPATQVHKHIFLQPCLIFSVCNTGHLQDYIRILGFLQHEPSKILFIEKTVLYMYII